MSKQTQDHLQIIFQPFSEQPLGAVLKAALTGQIVPFHTFRAAVAFVKGSGVKHIRAELQEFVQQGGLVQLIFGIDQLGSSREGLAGLLSALNGKGSVWINHSIEKYITFHPKMYLFVSDITAFVIIGSGNLTEGGLYTNDEASLMYWLDLHNFEDRYLLQEVNANFDKWRDITEGNALLLTPDLLDDLVEAGLIPVEGGSEDRGDETKTVAPKVSSQSSDAFFKKSTTKRVAPRYKTSRLKQKKSILSPDEPVSQPTESSDESYVGFVMILQRTDAGTGQTTAGTSRRSPEVFIPLAARNAFPEFWGWPDLFSEDAARPGKMDRLNVKMWIGGGLVKVNMMTWPVKHDFRLRSEALRSAGTTGDILRIEKPAEDVGFDYYVEIIPQGTSDYDAYLDLCVNSVRNSKKRWGYYR
ncbi:MAG: hypothetical protein HF973_04980 [Chloroflexi bacterium]|nr:hypothetical protein [Chloroflexota bacterium]